MLLPAEKLYSGFLVRIHSVSCFKCSSLQMFCFIEYRPKLFLQKNWFSCKIVSLDVHILVAILRLFSERVCLCNICGGKLEKLKILDSDL